MSTSDLFIGKGVVSWKPTGGSYRDVGNVPTFEFTSASEELKHYSSREGVKTLDRTVSLSVEGSIKFALEEFTLANLAMAVGGSDVAASGGDNFIEVLAETEITGMIKCVGSNDVGRKFEIELFNVTLKPGATAGFITDEFGRLEIEGAVQYSVTHSSYGKIREITASSES